MTTATTAVLAATGQLVDEETGEVLDVGSADLLGSLDTLHRAHQEQELARLAYEARLSVLFEADPELLRLATRRGVAAKTIADIESAIAGLRPSDDPTRSVVLDVGTVRVCWPKASERWTQSASPAEISATRPELAAELGIERVVGNPPKPRITVRLTKETNGRNEPK